MTITEANRIIKNGNEVTVHNTVYNEVFTAVFVGRDRHSIFSASGGVFSRDELDIMIIHEVKK